MTIELRGRVKFPIGGTVHDPLWRLIRCDSGTDGYSPDGRKFTTFFKALCAASLNVFFGPVWAFFIFFCGARSASM